MLDSLFNVRRKNVTEANNDDFDALWPELDEVAYTPFSDNGCNNLLTCEN